MKNIKTTCCAASLILLLLVAWDSHAQRRTKGAEIEIQNIENGLIPKVLIDSAVPKPFRIEDRMQFFKVPGVSIAVLKDGKLFWSKGYGIANDSLHLAVNTETRFQAASISKSLTAFAILRLAEEKHLDLDKDVNDYLTSWKVPESDFTKTEKVTIQRLLNHSAGISVQGFTGYAYSDKVPSTTMILNGRGNSPGVTVEDVPGSKFSYSGGGYIILQQLIEDLTKKTFTGYMQQEVLLPLKMWNSTFEQFPKGNVSLAYDNYGKHYAGGWFIMPELAAAGLWTTPSDLIKFCGAIQQAYHGHSGALLSQAMAKEMLKADQKWGLGLGLRGQGEAAFFFHGGKNKGFNNIMIGLINKDLAIIIMTNGEQGGIVRDEIVRAFGQYYNLQLQPPPRRVKPVAFGKNELSLYEGTYQWKENYLLELSVTTDSVLLKDRFDGKINHFIHLGNLTFIDPNTGDEVVLLKKADGTISISYNNVDTFIKVP